MSWRRGSGVLCSTRQSGGRWGKARRDPSRACIRQRSPGVEPDVVTAEGRATEPRIVAAILTYRGLEPTRNCLKTLARSTSWPLPVVVVDNSSGTDEGVALAKEIGAPVASIVTSSNGGVPGGYNAALAWAADHGASHVLLLNNDTLLEDRQMLAALVGNLRPDVAAVGPW